ncbi:MAG: Hsp20/alpha crystallin family protein [Lachnospiraceae bacterium]|nr:Hsp20/alpha crystallin family protein [Lachnospiraceae bacterium]
MLMPSIFGENLIDDFSFYPFTGYKEKNSMMKTDVKEDDEKYEIDMSIPGVKKEDIKAELKDGYLTVSAATSSENEEKDEKQRYIRRERYFGSCSRSFYVGKEITQDEIKAKYENGVLTIDIPKKEEKKKEVEEQKYIAIE